MKKNVVLFRSMTFAEYLTYEEAGRLLDLSSKSPAANFIDFYISSRADGSNDEKKWALVGYPRLLRDVFNDNPEDFVISTEE